MPELRYLQADVDADLATKMVFLAGPRQVGKTTLARMCLVGHPGLYLNWDSRQDRREIRSARWPASSCRVVLDELHKWRGWKGWLKGEYDTHGHHVQFLVTGSARLDVYRRGSDSLQGRYHHYRLHPFSLAELAPQGGRRQILPGQPLDLSGVEAGAEDLLRGLFEYGGFPEPALAQSARTLRRWQRNRLDRLFREDVRDLATVRDIGLIEELADALPGTVGSLLSLNALREDLEVSHRAVTHWIDVLERLYHVVLIRPFTARRFAGLKRMPKAYLWDWTLVDDRAARFENLVAMHLLKLCHALQDREGYRVDLRMLRDRAGREVDFLVTVDGRPWFAVEAKLAETDPDPALRYFQQRARIPWVYQVVMETSRDVMADGVRVVPAATFLGALV